MKNPSETQICPDWDYQEGKEIDHGSTVVLESRASYSVPQQD
jgi:hypothetical protein